MLIDQNLNVIISRILLTALPFACLALSAAGAAHSVDACASDRDQDLVAELIAGRIDSASALLDAMLASELTSITGLVDVLERQQGKASNRFDSLLSALPSSVLKRIRAATPQSAETHANLRSIANSALDALGRDCQVTDLLELNATCDEWRMTRAHGKRFQASLERLLLRGPSGYAVLRKDMVQIDPMLQTLSLRTIGGIPSQASVQLLIDLVGRSSHLDVAVLSQLNRLAGNIRYERNGDPFIRIRMLLTNGSPKVRREAALCVGSLRDFDGLPKLVDLLQDSSISVRHSAHHSLRRLTGFGFDESGSDWRRWHVRESKWWRENANACITRLRDEHPSAQVSATKELSRNRMNRDEVVANLCYAVESCHPTAASLAACALGTLDAYEARDVLIQGLEHPREMVREACLNSLRIIFDRDLPGETDAWLSAIGA
ncbi:MAG: HEAT repeat protein [Planctomycetota bacterium]